MKPLLFLLHQDSGTVGDQKPFCILAVIAASVSQTPVTLLCDGFTNPPLFMDAIYRFRDFITTPKMLRIEYTCKHANQDEFWDDLETRFFIFDNYDCDFGASVERAKNRFTTKLFSYKAKLLKRKMEWTMISSVDLPIFGPVMLPSKINDPFWSASKTIDKLIDFEQQNKDRIKIGIAGSLHLPFSENEIQTWIKKNHKTRWWAFVIVDPYERFDFDDENILLLDYIEFEDLVRFVDVFISNCGAGSVMTAMQAGLVQTCQIANSVGPDKPFNQAQIARLGPSSSSTLKHTMIELKEHYSTFSNRAIKQKYIINDETKQMVRNMQHFFEELSSNGILQDQFFTSRQIPTKYALD